MFHDYFLSYLAGRTSGREVMADEVYGETNLLDASGAFDPTKYHRFPRYPLETSTAIIVAICCGLLLALILLACNKMSKKKNTEPDPNEIRGINGLYLAVVLDSYGVTMCLPYLGMLGLKMRLSAFQGSLIGTVFAFSQTIGTIILGICGDYIDRRWILTSTLGFCSVSIFACGLCLNLPYGLDADGNKVGTNWAYYGFLFARMIGGFFASTVSIIETLIAERSTDETRTGNIGKVMGYFGFGAIAGPIVGGLVYDFGFEVLCYSAAAVTLVNTVWASLTLEKFEAKKTSKPVESNTQEGKTEEKIVQKGNDENPLCDGLAQLKKHPIIFLLLFATAWATGSATLAGSVGGLFTLQVYQWGPFQIALMTLVGGILGTWAQLTLPGYWSHKMGDAGSIMFGFFYGSTLGLIGITFIYPATPWIMVLPGCIGGTFVNAQLQSLLTSYSPPQSLGTLFGFMQAMRSFGEGFTPPIGGWLLDKNLKLPFYVSSVMGYICGCLFIPFVLRKPPAKDS